MLLGTDHLIQEGEGLISAYKNIWGDINRRLSFCLDHIWTNTLMLTKGRHEEFHPPHNSSERT